MTPVHVHLVLNHVPVLGVAFAICLLAAGLVKKSDSLARAALATLVVAAALAVPTFLTGEPAEHAVETLPGVLETRIEQHEAAAKVALAVVVSLGLLSLACLVAWRNRSEVPRLGAVAVLLVALASAGTLGYAANLGGQIRHTEIADSSSLAPPRGQGDAAPTSRTDERRHREHEGERH